MLNIGDEMMVVRFGKEGCTCAQPPWPGQLTRPSRLRNALRGASQNRIAKQQRSTQHYA